MTTPHNLNSPPISEGSRKGDKDWAKIRARLARAVSALDDSQRLSPERTRAILEERARVLAQVPAQAPQAADMVEVLIFTLSGERYAVETDCVREVLRLGGYTEVPGTPDILMGVMNLRGQIVALFDLRKLLGIPGAEASDAARVIILGGDRAEFGILAEEVFEVARLRADQVLPPAESVTGPSREFIRGVTEKALILLHGAMLLKDPRLFVDEGGDLAMIEK
jgi:purine-binding chemotaxis protein CheW